MRRCEHLGSNCYIECNPYRLAQVFINVLNNSIEAFGIEKGIIKIITQSTFDNFNEINNVQVIIEDNAKGITSKSLEMIFEPEVSSKTNQNLKGLGLSVVKRITKEHNGTIEVISPIMEKIDNWRRGSRFIFTFPYSNYKIVS